MDNHTITMPSEMSDQAAPSRGLSANALKLIAILAMLCDHIAVLFLNSSSILWVIMRLIGRTTGPIMFFFVAEGYQHTHNVNRYTLRLAIFAAISYCPYIFAFYGGNLIPDASNWLSLNVIYTILIGLLAIRARHELQNPVLKIVVILLLAVCSIPGDWGVVGFTIMLSFDYFHGNFKNQAVAYVFIVLFQHGLFEYLTYPLITYVAMHQWIFLDAGTYWILSTELGMFLPIILLAFYRGQKGRGGKLAKWGFYLFYPAHMLLLGWILYDLL